MTPESSLLRAVTDLLTAERIWWMRCATGAIVLPSPSGKKRVFKAGRAGMADLLALPLRRICAECGRWGKDCSGLDDGCDSGDGYVSANRALWLELKSPKGRQSAAQKAFQAEVEAEGHTYLLVRDAMEVAEWLKR